MPRVPWIRMEKQLWKWWIVGKMVQDNWNLFPWLLNAQSVLPLTSPRKVLEWYPRFSSLAKMAYANARLLGFSLFRLIVETPGQSSNFMQKWPVSLTGNSSHVILQTIRASKANFAHLANVTRKEVNHRVEGFVRTVIVGLRQRCQEKSGAVRWPRVVHLLLSLHWIKTPFSPGLNTTAQNTVTAQAKYW